MRPCVLVPAATLMLGCKSTEPPPASQGSSQTARAPAVTQTGEVATSTTPSEAPASVEMLQSASPRDGEFAAKLYKAAPGTGNRLISPLSIRMAFAMTYAGAKGETAAELQSALAFRGEPNAVHEGYQAVLGDFAARAKVPDVSQLKEWQREEALGRTATLRVVNRIWGQTGKTFLSEFKSVLEKKYVAPLEQLDFKKDAEGARVRINGWVEENTEKKIKDLIPPGMLTSDTPLVLTNAVYFKAAWQDPFTEALTKQEDFFAEGTHAKKAAMMHSGGFRGYAETREAQVLELPYSDGSLSMIFVLPKAKTGLKAMEEALKGSDFSAWTSGLKHQLVTHTIPKFKFNAGLPALVEAMKALGAKRAFKFPDADFSGMDGTHELFIGAAVHKTFIDVNEKGTEAAAATAIAMRAGSAPPRDEPKTFVADHPFLFFIYDKRTASVLFLGRVTDPTK